MYFQPKRFLPLAMFSLLAGCQIPVPSSIGLGMVDEVDISVQDLADASLFSERCGAAGFESENLPAMRAIQKLSAPQQQAFDERQSDPQMRSDIEDSVNQKACADHAAEFRRLGAKTMNVTLWRDIEAGINQPVISILPKLPTALPRSP